MIENAKVNKDPKDIAQQLDVPSEHAGIHFYRLNDEEMQEFTDEEADCAPIIVSRIFSR